MVTSGYIGGDPDTSDVEVYRDGVRVTAGPVAELRRFKNIVKKVRWRGRAASAPRARVTC